MFLQDSRDELQDVVVEWMEELGREVTELNIKKIKIINVTEKEEMLLRIICNGEQMAQA